MPSPEPLASVYDPKAVEPEIRDFWSASGHFHADPAAPGEPYVIVIPPPNVTGALHGGHALNNTLQDILIRWHRMRGRNTEWMPGTDHAGIATQAVVERTIFEQEKKTRHDLGREELVRRIWDWKNAYGNRIIEQLKLMGCSCDWERLRFTLDDMCARAVRETFFRMFRDGLIVRGKRLVNWDTHLQTAVADDEVYHEKVKGHLWHIRYPLARLARSRATGAGGGEGARGGVGEGENGRGVEHLVVATTRPETMLGDTAVAVHPDDQRWNWLIGHKVTLPLTGREIPVIGDPLLVSMEFGTGCVKVTPAHDPNDYQCGLRHQLPMLNILTPDGKINEEGGAYQGLDRYAARKKIVADLEAAGLLEKVDDHESDIGHSDRSKTPIEPYLSDQWFVKMGDLTTEEAARIQSEHMREYINTPQVAGAFPSAKEPRASARAAQPQEQNVASPDPDASAVSPGRFAPSPGSPAEAAPRGLKPAALCPGLAQLAIDAICEQPHATAEERKACGKVHFFPERYANTYRDWLSEKRDWCISRQLWWGHRIPVFRATFGGLRPGQTPDQYMEETLSELRAALDELGRLTNTVGDYHVSRPENVAGYCFICVRTEAAYRHLVRIKESLDTARAFGLGAPDLLPRRIPPGEVLHGVSQKFWHLFVSQDHLEQDPDVLDTWFSSALWPHSTMGWPEATPEMDRYYPGNVLSTAREIITLWVARMVLTGRYNVGKVPFHDVYIHTVIQDGQGRPFKKTLGNGFDPVDIIEQYGADALRFTMANLATETQDVRLPVKKIKLDDGRELPTSDRFELGRNFCNKIWNAARFAFMNLEGNAPAGQNPPLPPLAKGGQAMSPTGERGRDMPPTGEGGQTLSPTGEAGQSTLPIGGGSPATSPASRGDRTDSPPLSKGGQGGVLNVTALPIEDRWILSRVSRAAVEIQDTLAKFNFSRAASLARDFFWDSLCDWYLELVKSRIADNRQADEARQVLAFALDQALRLLHPFVPYITERLWRQLNDVAPQRGFPGLAELDTGKPLIVSLYPPVEGWTKLNDPAADAVFNDLQTATRAVREIRSTRNVPPKNQVNVIVKVPAARVESLRQQAHVLKRLANVGELIIDPAAVQPKNAATLVFDDMQIFVLDVIDTAAERQRLEGELANIDKQVNAISGKLANEGFVSRAPANVVAAEREKLTTLQARREIVVKTMAEL